MRTLFTATISALAILAGTANAATIKTIWNFAVADQEGARVTQPSDCLRETNAVGTCFTDPEPAPEEEDPAA